ncbi:GNAT family N-acetyltransferase [Thiofilum flexile]|uniref:GNAT family N-acetyltransferase n=1 Tax=Thiofilum flexile TaxID=125627 RepID=UPI00035FD00E|nr:GNAT family protein [Thiofilum flexile]
MMFRLTVDDEISLYLISETFVARYVELVAADESYLAQWMEWPRHCKTEEEFKQFVKSSLHHYAEGQSMTCAIAYYDEVVGNVGFNTINHTLKVAEIGYWLGQQYQGKGIVTRACRYLIDYAFKVLELEKVQISAAEDNLPSRAVCERLGMQLEGIITNREKVGNRILNHAIYGIHKNK